MRPPPIVCISGYADCSVEHRRVSVSNPSVSSNHRISHNPSVCINFLYRVCFFLNSFQLSSTFSAVSDRMRNSLRCSDNRTPSPLTTDNFPHLPTFGTPQSAPLSHSQIWRRASISIASPDECFRASSQLSQLSEPAIRPIYEEEDDHDTYEIYDQYPEYNDHSNTDTHSQTYRRSIPTPSIPTPPPSARVSQPPSRPVYHAVSTAKPTLMFAIASDDVAEVKRVLESGDAGPNDAVGPQTALEFALTNGQLVNKMDIVKTLLAYGADPRAVKQYNGIQRRGSVMVEDLIAGNVPGDVQEPPSDNAVTSLMDEIDPALK